MLRCGDSQKILKQAVKVGLFDDLVGAHTYEGEYVTSYGLGTDSTNTKYVSVSNALYNSSVLMDSS